MSKEEIIRRLKVIEAILSVSVDPDGFKGWAEVEQLIADLQNSNE